MASFFNQDCPLCGTAAEYCLPSSSRASCHLLMLGFLRHGGDSSQSAIKPSGVQL